MPTSRRPALWAAVALLVAAVLLVAACGDDDSSSTGTSAATGTSTTASSSAPSELRDYPYCELIPNTVSGDTRTEHIFNTLPYGPCPPKKFPEITEQDVVDAYNTAYGAAATDATINGPRHWVLDSITSTGGVTSSGDTLTVDGLKLGLVGQIEGPTSEPTVGSEPYVVNTVQRDTVYHFKKGTNVYELTDPSGAVYTMVSYSQQVNDSLSLRTLGDIGAGDQLPTGWTYAARRLTEDLDLTAAGTTKIVNDYYRNTFQINPAAK